MKTKIRFRNQINYKLELDYPIHEIKNYNHSLLSDCSRTARQVKNSLKRNGFNIPIEKIERVCDKLENTDYFYTSLSDEDIIRSL